MGAAIPASSVVTTALQGDVLVVTIDNPPVNALGAAVRQGLLAAMQQAQADAAVAAVLLVGAGKAFIAGADIREFGKPPVAPILPEVCRAIENLNKPVVAVLHGDEARFEQVHVQPTVEVQPVVGVSRARDAAAQLAGERRPVECLRQLRDVELVQRDLDAVLAVLDAPAALALPLLAAELARQLEVGCIM